MILDILRYLMWLVVSDSDTEPYQLHSLPSIGGARCHKGPKISVPSPLSPQESFDPPNWNMNHQKSVKLGDPLKDKCITVALGPFESKVDHLYIAIAVGPLLK